MSGPGRSYRTGISLQDLFRLFPDDEAAEAWFIKKRWPGGVVCPHCGSTNVQEGAKHPSMPFRCREKECGKRFSTKTGTIMEGSKLGYQTWLVAAYLLSTSLKSVSSTKLARDLNITQRSAWFLAHRLRAALKAEGQRFYGPVEIDETYVGGRYKNRPRAVRDRMALEMGWGGSAGKEPVVGIRDRPTGHVAARAIYIADRRTLLNFLYEHVKLGSTVYSDGAAQYRRIPYDHHAVEHSEEYVRGDVHTNGLESFWSMIKRAYKGTFHKLSPKHLDRYVQEFAGRHNLREQDTIEMMAAIAIGMRGKRLRYTELIAPNGLPNGSRPTASR
ncbi:MAG: IS1595 family transposase [Chloroflexota bacterium]|nr:IS1595 family transposase [Chloroflexota bacterium]